MKLYEQLLNEIANQKHISAWNKGISNYCFELLETLKEYCEDNKEPETSQELHKIFLNGAESWSEYSWGGCSLIYNEDIAKTLCTPSELKRTKNGERQPNKNEEWLDTQARALNQAENRLIKAYKRINRLIC